MKNWDLSYECITSEAAKYTLRERLEEDPHFALSVSIPHIDKDMDSIPEDSENTYDHCVDDPALSADQLARTLGLLGSSDNIAQESGYRFEKDNEGNVILLGGIDDELTDADAEGETDPEEGGPDSDLNSQASQAHSDLDFVDPEAAGYPIEDAIIRGIRSVFSNADIPLGIEDPTERYVMLLVDLLFCWLMIISGMQN
jgi:hypothetical protein